jgi:hypothetical protein
MSQTELEAEAEYTVAKFVLLILVLVLSLGFLAADRMEIPDDCKELGAAAFVQGGVGLTKCKKTK